MSKSRPWIESEPDAAEAIVRLLQEADGEMPVDQIKRRIYERYAFRPDWDEGAYLLGRDSRSKARDLGIDPRCHDPATFARYGLAHEPMWWNRVRQAHRHLIDAGVLDPRAPRGIWRLAQRSR